MRTHLSIIHDGAAAVLLVLIVATIATIGCSGEAVQSTPQAQLGRGGGGQNAAVPVNIAKAVQKRMPITIQAIGTGIAASTVPVRAQITGEMTSGRFKEGEDVEKGQVLATPHKPPVQTALPPS